jgi:large subunit ribosomal protein L17
VNKRKLNRGRNGRQALFYSLFRELVLHGAIATTYAKGKAIQPQVDKLLSLVKKDSLNARRQVGSQVRGDKEVLGLLFGKYLPLAKSRTSGFTRLTVTGLRKGDAAKMVRLEFLEIPVSKEAKPKKEKKEKKVKKEKSSKGRKK